MTPLEHGVALPASHPENNFAVGGLLHPEFGGGRIVYCPRPPPPPDWLGMVGMGVGWGGFGGWWVYCLFGLE